MNLFGGVGEIEENISLYQVERASSSPGLRGVSEGLRVVCIDANRGYLKKRAECKVCGT